jgi:calcium-dependent protein kinase
MGCFPQRKIRKINIDYTSFDNNKKSVLSSINNNCLSRLSNCETIKQIKIERGQFVQENYGDPLEKYDIVSTLGSGSYGKVYKVNIKNTQIFRAMKVIKKRYIYNSLEEEKIKKEIDILKSLDHPNIIRVFEFYNTMKKLYIISELCNGGELFDQIIKFKNFDEKKASIIMNQLFSAINFCHTNKILHRDLKPENILMESFIDEKNKKTLNIKVIDFGTAEIFKNKTMLSKLIGTPFYIAPDVLKNEYNEKCDIWSCGIIMYIMLCGSPPFYGKNETEIFNKIKLGNYSFTQNIWNEISNNAKDLIKSLLQIDHDNRPSAEKALKHPWFKQFPEELINENVNSISVINDRDSFLEKYEKVNIAKKEKDLELKKGIELISYKDLLMNLKNFRAKQKLQQATLYFMVQQLVSSEEVQEIRNIFLKFDENKDGRLTKEEILKGIKKIKSLYFSSEDLENLMEFIDIDKNGYIEYQEFISATISKEKLITEENLKRSFDMFDKDQNGKITPLELKLVLGSNLDDDNLNEDVWREIILGIDLDGDGEISYYEFKKMMNYLISYN